jgi:hypothetical protein
MQLLTAVLPLPALGSDQQVLDPKLVKGFWREEEDEMLLYLKVTSAELPW